MRESTVQDGEIGQYQSRCGVGYRIYIQMVYLKMRFHLRIKHYST